MRQETNAPRFIEESEQLDSKPIQVAESDFQIRTVVARVTVVLGKDCVLVFDVGVRGRSTIAASTRA